MSVEAALDALELDVESNSAICQVRIDDVFDENGELRLAEDDEGWSGYLLEDGAFYSINTWRDQDDPARKLRVGSRAVELAIREQIRGGIEGAADA